MYHLFQIHISNFPKSISPTLNRVSNSFSAGLGEFDILCSGVSTAADGAAVYLALVRYFKRRTVKMIEIPQFTLLKQGAEARIYSGIYLGRPAVIKERFVKSYRHEELDTLLTKDRMKAEARAIVRCKAAGIYTPALFLVDFDRRRIYMEHFTRSQTVKDFIESQMTSGGGNSSVPEVVECLAREIGRVVGKMHAHNIIHGDLTTSNMLLVNRGDGGEHGFEVSSLTLIDFGLAHLEPRVEDKGVDLYVLERALLSTHRIASKIVPIIIDSYKKANKKGAKEVMIKYEDVRARGRKRTMVG